jgi:hypothetical protein
VLYRSQYEVSLSITTSTSNYRILRRPRPILGESPVQLPGNIVVDLVSKDPGLPLNKPPVPPQLYSTLQPSVSGALDILFSPSGAVIDANGSLGNVYLFVHDINLVPNDPSDPDPSGTLGRTGLIAIQTRTGFIAAYNVGPAGTPFYYASQGRSSGL